MTENGIPVWKATWALIKFRPKFLAANFIGRSFFVLSRLFPGLIIQRILDQLTGAAPATINITTLLVMILAIEVSRMVGYFWGGWASAVVRNQNQYLLRLNIVKNVLKHPAALGIPMSPGEAINRLDDDVADFADFPTWLPEMFGHLVFFVTAMVIMARISWQITAVAAIPIVLVLFLNRFAWNKFLYYITKSRDASSAVTGYLGEILGAVQAVKVADAQPGVMGYFETLNETRRQANVRYATFWAIFRSAADNAGDIGIALMVLLAGQGIVDGTFSIGDFALFTSYLFFAARFPAEIGSYISEWAQQRVSIQRMLSIQPVTQPESLIQHQTLYIQNDILSPSVPRKTAQDTLQILEVCGLSYAFPIVNHVNQSGENETFDQRRSKVSGIFDINLSLPRGSFTVITGRVGSGKSTLLKVLLGLLPKDAGEIKWNGRLVNDPTTFFKPPRSAYTPQVPRLFSDSLKDNILMGLPENADWQHALEMAVLTPDIVQLENGIETKVGPRGVRLSGGQVQRAAAARMFVRQAELMVFDDLSSALDVETEKLLWQRLGIGNWETSSIERPSDQTCLVVSHRPAVLQQADQIIIMENGRLAAQGKWDEIKNWGLAFGDQRRENH